MSCHTTGKVGYPTKRAARQARNKLPARSNGGSLSIYRCEHCGCYHLGHKPAAVNRGELAKDEWLAKTPGTASTLAGCTVSHTCRKPGWRRGRYRNTPWVCDVCGRAWLSRFVIVHFATGGGLDGTAWRWVEWTGPKKKAPRIRTTKYKGKA